MAEGRTSRPCFAVRDAKVAAVAAASNTHHMANAAEASTRLPAPTLYSILADLPESSLHCDP